MAKGEQMPKGSTAAPPEAPQDCPLCPRLVAFRVASQQANPMWFNGAVPSFGDASGRLAIVGLAPGLQGANKTGRPFTGDYAGDLLYSSLAKYGRDTRARRSACPRHAPDRCRALPRSTMTLPSDAAGRRRCRRSTAAP